MHLIMSYLAMLRMTHHIKVDGKSLNRLVAVEIEKTAEQMSDRATLQVNAMTAGRALQTEETIYAGLPLSIALGYEGDNKHEFAGYIVSTTNQDGLLRIACEDAMYLLRKDVTNQQLTDASLVEIAKQVLQEVAPTMKVVAGEGLDAIRFDEFNIVDATAWDVLRKLKEQGGINAYVRGQTLYLSLRYLQDAGAQAEVRYNFSRNVEQSSLKYVRAEERKVLVKVIGIGKDNKRYEATAGESGQDSITLSRYNITDTKALQAIAEEEHKKWSYTGYEGSLTSWLLPYATYGMKATIADELYPEREGTYIVTRVRTRYDEQGGRRQVYLGQKIA